MLKHSHEIRDPIHVFVRLEDAERRILDSRPFQRLRYIHQLGLTYLVYPGATHRRFEHSLGVMELASRVYDVVTQPDNLYDESIAAIVPHPPQYEHSYWRRVVRMAALCHDLGHLPFSHAAEKELLPEGYDHEKLTADIICSDELQDIWDSVKINCEDVAKIAVGPKKIKKAFNDWEAILSEIIVGDAFGVDRMDYLLRDSYHAGVAYGRFDHYRLIDTIRILPKTIGTSTEPALGVEQGGLHSAEALLLARYFMFTQLYLHHVRRIYDIHLRDFLQAWLPAGKFSTNLIDLLQTNDNDILVGLANIASNTNHLANKYACCIVKREHFKRIYQRNPHDVLKNPEAAKKIYNEICKQFGEENVRYDSYIQKGGAPDFPVMLYDGSIVSSLLLSETLKNLPVAAIDYVFIDDSIRKEADKWLLEKREKVIATAGEEENE